MWAVEDFGIHRYRFCADHRVKNWDETKMHIVNAYVPEDPTMHEPNVLKIQTMFFIGFKDSNGGQGIYLS